MSELNGNYLAYKNCIENYCIKLINPISKRRSLDNVLEHYRYRVKLVHDLKEIIQEYNIIVQKLNEKMMEIPKDAHIVTILKILRENSLKEVNK